MTNGNSILGLTIEIIRVLSVTTFVKLAAFLVMKPEIPLALLIV